MTWLNNLSIRWKLTGPIALLAIILVVIVIMGLRQVQGLGTDITSFAENLLPSQNYLLQADRDLFQAQVAERSLIFLNAESEKRDQMAQMLNENVMQARDRISKFFETTTITAARQRKHEFWGLFENWVSKTNEIKQLLTTGGRTGRRTAIEMTFREGDEAFNIMRDVIDEMTGMVEQQSQKQAGAAAEDIHHGNIVMLTSLGFGLVLCIAIALMFPPLVIRPLKRMIQTVEDLASGNGDLTIRLDEESKDELGCLAGGFNRFLAKLHELVSTLASTSQQVKASSKTMLELNEEVQAAVASQNDATTSVASAITEMSATVQSIASNAVDAASAAAQADADASNGNDLVESSTKAILSLAENVEQASEVINQLNNETISVGSVLEVISGIAEQTNLLALNAAIEAARAGDQGRGFAVVADEVRKLASRTQASTTEIHEIIERLQHGAQDAVSVMARGKENAQNNVNQAEATREALRGIKTAVASISAMNTEIASAAEEQSVVTENINQNILEISTISDNTSNISVEAANNSSTLDEYAEALEKIVANFKI